MLKAIDSDSKPVVGIARNVTIGVGEWSGKTYFNVVDMDDYPLIMGMEFLRQAKFVCIPYLNMVFVMDEGSPCCVPIVGKPNNGKKKALCTLHALSLEHAM